MKLIKSINKEMRVPSLLFFLSFLVLLLALILSITKLSQFNNELLFYVDHVRSIDFFGSKIDVISLVGFGFILSLINFFLARFFSRREQFLSLILALANLFITILLLLAVFAIIANN